jgi:hypothetical protein
MDKILAYAEVLSKKLNIPLEGVDLSDLDTETSYRKDNGELNASSQKEIEKRLKALASKPKKYIAKNSILHDGKVYKTGDDITGVIAQEGIDELVFLGAVTVTE